MPISTTAPARDRFSPARHAGRRPAADGMHRRAGCAAGEHAGFTLLEVTLVLLIFAVMFALLLPRLRDPGRAELEAQSSRLAQTFRWLRSEAVMNGVTYQLNFDLDQQRYWVSPVEGEGTDLAEFAHEVGSLARGTQLQPPVGMVDVVLPTLAGKIAEGQIYTMFYPDGTVDMTVIHMANGRDAYTLYLNPMNGRLKVVPGYHEVEYAS